MRAVRFAAALGVVLGFASTARAEEEDLFGTAGQLALGLERLSGFYWITQQVQGNNYTSQNFAFLGQRSTGYSDIPRLGVDYFVGDALSLGGSFVYYSQGQDYHTTVFGFTARVGYAIMLSPAFGFWPRAGFSGYSGSFRDGLVKESAFLTNIEGYMVYSPASYIAFVFGPTFDVALGGSRDVTSTTITSGRESSTTTSYDFTEWSSALVTAGFLAWF